MDRYRLKRALKKTSDFLVSPTSREFFVFLFFLAVAAIFWMLQTLDETLDKRLTVPLELVNVPEDVVITSPLPDQVTVYVSDKGTSLIHYLRHGVQPVQISFNDYSTTPEGGKVTIPTTDATKLIQASLLPTSRIKSITPDTLEFYYNHGLSKTVPVIVAGTVQASPDCYLLDIKPSPAEVQVFASTQVLDTLTAVYTTPVALTELSENTYADVSLLPIKGAKFSEQKVRLEVLVDVYMENTVDVPIHSTNFPASKHLTTFPSEAQVTYTVGYAQSKTVKPEDFVILLAYEQILECQRQGNAKIPLTLRNIPEGVSDVRIEPQEVDYLVEMNDSAE